jgi:hypothetical protein
MIPFPIARGADTGALKNAKEADDWKYHTPSYGQASLRKQQARRTNAVLNRSSVVLQAILDEEPVWNTEQRLRLQANFDVF